MTELNAYQQWLGIPSEQKSLDSSGFEFPEEGDFNNDTVFRQSSSVSCQSTKSRAGLVVLMLNLIVLCCVGTGGWWLLDRGFLPQINAIWQPTNAVRAVDDSADVEVVADEEGDVARVAQL